MALMIVMMEKMRSIAPLKQHTDQLTDLLISPLSLILMQSQPLPQILFVAVISIVTLDSHGGGGPSVHAFLKVGFAIRRSIVKVVKMR